MLGLAVSLTFFLITLFVAWRSPKRGALLCIALLPWNGLEVDLGIRITAYLLAIMALIPAVLLRYWKGVPWQIDRSSFQAFHPFVVFVIVSSLLQVFYLPDADIAGGVLRGPVVRALIQVIVFGLVLSPIWVFPMVFRTISDLLDAGRVYVVSCFGLVILGFFQVGIWYLTGNDPLPIGVINQALNGANPEFTRSGTFILDGQSIYRMSSLGGEPKNLGLSLVVAIFLLQSSFVYSKKPLTIRGVLAWMSLIAAVFMTQSSSAFGVLAAATVLAVLAYTVSASKRPFRAGLATGATVCCAIGLFAFGIVLAGDRPVEKASRWTANVLAERTVGRGTMIEDFDQAILGFMNDHPERYWLGVGLGNIHLHADSYLSTPARRYAGGKVFFAKSGYLKILSESGVVGLALFLLACIGILLRLKRLASHQTGSVGGLGWASLLRTSFVFLVVAYFARVYLGGQLFACAGIMTAACSVIYVDSRVAASLVQGLQFSRSSANGRSTDRMCVVPMIPPSVDESARMPHPVRG